MFPYSHAVLFTELFDSELVYGRRHVFDWLLQILGVTLYQRVGDAASAVLKEESCEKDIEYG